MGVQKLTPSEFQGEFLQYSHLKKAMTNFLQKVETFLRTIVLTFLKNSIFTFDMRHQNFTQIKICFLATTFM